MSKSVNKLRCIVPKCRNRIAATIKMLKDGKRVHVAAYCQKHFIEAHGYASKVMDYVKIS